MSRQQVDYYRKTRAVDIKAIVAAGQQAAMTEGLAVVAERVIALKKLAALMESDLFGGFLWLDQVKTVGSGDTAQIVDYEIFNASEVSAYRATLDDIAKETGGRVSKSELTGKDGGPIQTEDMGIDQAERDRSITALANTITNHVYRGGGSGDGAVDTPE